MFISRAQADARLSSKLNRFSENFGQDEQKEETPAEQAETPDAVVVDEEPEGPVEVVEAHAADEPVLTELAPSSMIAFDALDDLIAPRQQRVRYRGNVEAQAAIAQTSLLIGQHAAGRVFGISQEQTLAYERGLQSTNQITEGGNSPELTKRVKRIREEIEERAASKLMSTLGLLTDERMEGVKSAREITSIAKDLSTVMNNVSKNGDSAEGGVHFHIFKPEISVESEYKVVQIGVKS